MGVVSILLTLALALLLGCACLAELQRFEHAAKRDGTLSFLVIGDWGRKGFYNQSQVALQMGIIGEKLDVDFIISTGDNFYENGLTGVDDPLFHQSFTDIYTAPSLQKQWYTVLGNHDYSGNVEAQLSPILTEMDSRWLCLKSYVLNAGPEIAEIFFIDTTPFVGKYFTDPEGHVYDWRGILPRKNYIRNTLMELESALRESTAKWKIVVGHHTIKSAGPHGNTDELAKHLVPILHAYNVDFYINGHDHCLEHISTNKSPTQFLTSGGGSRAWMNEIKWWNPEEMKFYYDGQGFMSMKMTQTVVDVAFYDVFGNVLHKWNNSNQLSFAI